MPTIVELPDSTRLEFPDGMDESAMQSEILKAFPQFTPQEPPAVPEPGQTITGPVTPSQAPLPWLPRTLQTQPLAAPPISQAIPEPRLEAGQQAIQQQLTPAQITALGQSKGADELGQGIQPVGQPGTVAYGASSLLAPMVDDPMLLGMSMFAPTRVAMGIAYTPQMLIQGLKDLGLSTQGDQEALGRAMVELGPFAIGGVEGGRRLARRAQMKSALEPMNRAAIDALARQGMEPPLSLLPPIAAEQQFPKPPRPVVPATPPEPQRDVPVLREIREVGAKTKEAVRALYPHLSREQAAELRDLAWQQQELLPGDIERVFKLADLGRQDYQRGAPGVTGRPPGGSIREMTPRPELQGGAPTVTDIQTQRALETQDLRPFSVEWTRLRKLHPTWSDDDVWYEIFNAIRAGKISAPMLPPAQVADRWAHIMSLERPASRAERITARIQRERDASEGRREVPPTERFLRTDEGVLSMTPRPPGRPEQAGAPSVEDVRAQRELERRMATEFRDLRRANPRWSNQKIWDEIMRAVKQGKISVPGVVTLPGRYSPILSLERPASRRSERNDVAEAESRILGPSTEDVVPATERRTIREMSPTPPGQPEQAGAPSVEDVRAQREFETRRMRQSAEWKALKEQLQKGIDDLGVRNSPTVPDWVVDGAFRHMTENAPRREMPSIQQSLGVQTMSGIMALERPNTRTSDRPGTMFGPSWSQLERPPLEYPSHLRAGARGQEVPLPYDPRTKPGEPYASSQRETEALHGNVPAQPETGVPVQEGGGGVRTPSEGRLPETQEAQQALRLAQSEAFSPPPEIAPPAIDRPAPAAPEQVTQSGSPEEAPASMAKPSPTAEEGPPALSTGSLITPESPQQPEGGVGPGMIELGAARAGLLPDTPSRFRHWWDQNIGKPSARVKPTIQSLWAGRAIRENMAYLRDWVDNSSRLFGRNAAGDVRKPLERIVRGITRPLFKTFKRNFELADNALTFVVEAGGDRNKLQDFRDMILNSPNSDPWWKQQAVDALDFAIYHWDDLQPVADTYRQYTNAQLDIENASGIPTLKRLNYVPHRQELEEMTLLTTGAQGTSTFFERTRKWPTYAESIASGRDPVSLRASDLLENRLNLGMRLVNSREWMNMLRGWTDPVTGLRVAADPKVQRRVDGRTYNVPPTPEYTVEFTGNNQPIAILKGYAGVFNALTDPSWFRTNPAMRWLLTANATGKSVNLMFDSFHAGRVAFWDSLIKTLGVRTFKAPFPSYKKGVTLLDYTENQIREMGARGEIPQKWLAELTENKRLLNLAIGTGYNIGRISDGLYNDIIHSIPIVGPFNRFVFDQFQRGAMAESWLLEYKRYRRGLPQLSETEVARRVSKDLNERFGNIGRQGWLLKSQNAQDIARFLFLAPQWNAGLIHSEVGALRDLPRAMIDAKDSHRIFAGVLMRSVGAMALAQFAVNQIINQATRHKFTWENPEEGLGAKLSAWVPDLVEGGPGFFLHPLGLAAETTHLISSMYGRHGGDIREISNAYLRSRSSAVMKPVATWITGEDFLGRRIQPGTLWFEMLRSSLALPIAGQAAAAFGKQLITGEPSSAFQGQYQKQAMSSLGVRTERAPSYEQRMLALAQTWRREHGVPQNVQIMAPGEYGRLTSALRVGNMGDARRSVMVLRKDKTDDEIQKHFDRWAKAPFTGTLAREREFLDGLSPEQRVAYLRARQQRELIAARVSGLLR